MCKQAQFPRIIVTLILLCLIFPISTGCGKSKPSHLSEYQHWIDYNSNIKNMMNACTEAFYRDKHRMPGSLEELQMSEWYWFEPIAPDYADEFEIVDRELGTYEEDGDKIQVGFTETGITYTFYYRASEETSQPHMNSQFGSANAKTVYDNNIENDIESGQFDVTNSGYIRQNMIYAISRLLVRRYYEENHSMPGRGTRLFSGFLEPRRDALLTLQLIPLTGPTRFIRASRWSMRRAFSTLNF